MADNRSQTDARFQIESWLFDALDRIHAAIEGAQTVEQLLGTMLDAALDIFGSERALATGSSLS